MSGAAPAACGAYKPRRPQASPLFSLVSDHLRRLQTVYDDRFAREYGPWRPVVAQVADRLLACGVFEHGFARIRCDDCAHEYLLGFSKYRYFCPSCHAKRLAIWAQRLDTTLLAPVPQRQVVLTIPKRLRAYCSCHRRLPGEIARVAARTVTYRRPMALAPTGIHTSTCSSPTAGSAPTAPSSRGRPTTRRV